MIHGSNNSLVAPKDTDKVALALSIPEVLKGRIVGFEYKRIR